MSAAADRLAARAGDLLVAGFDGVEPSAEILELIRMGLGAVILYRKNCADALGVLDLTNRLQEAARASGRERPLLVAIDQEQGRVVRVAEGMTVFPAMGAVAAARDVDLVERIAATVARELAALGVSWNLAPVADVLSAPGCPVGDRSFGEDPALVAELVAAWVRGARRAGALCCAKHFPGHGGTGADSHFAAPTIGRSAAQLDAVDLVPFRAAVAAGVPAVMTTHITFPALDPASPASLSREVVTGLLRGRIGFTGVVVSDDLEMAGVALGRDLPSSALAALAAGTDLLIASRMLLPERDLPGLLARLRRAIAGGELDPEAVAASLRRVEKLAEGLPWRVEPGAARVLLRSARSLHLREEVRRRGLG